MYYFKRFKDLAFLDLIYLQDGDQSAVRKKIVDEVIEIDDTALLIKVYLSFSDFDAALDALSKNLSYNLLVQNDQVIFDHDPARCYDLYKQLLDSYLKEHFGTHAQDFVRQTFHFLIRHGRNDWVKSLKEHLKSQYTNRKYLLKS